MYDILDGLTAKKKKKTHRNENIAQKELLAKRIDFPPTHFKNWNLDWSGLTLKDICDILSLFSFFFMLVQQQ